MKLSKQQKDFVRKNIKSFRIQVNENQFLSINFHGSISGKLITNELLAYFKEKIDLLDFPEQYYFSKEFAEKYNFDFSEKYFE